MIQIKIKLLSITLLFFLVLAGCMRQGASPEEALTSEPQHIYAQSNIDDVTVALAYLAEDEINVATVQKQGGSWYVLEELNLGEPTISNIETVLEGQFVIAGFAEQGEEISVDHLPITLGDTGEVKGWFLTKEI
ncbi:hypothetical protein RYX56_00275 [Alkalihalophilus lindianensis]|uniref:DUF3221 domain-containing protein n=1 Tax=Alkalihalophilus lindianensis TaxID=1630542 RepID=A0ABU3X5S0_9BACI|nr:hypothetical protein [Alkalihalophilus lindianensis]MDV2682799.1 hypothetical protein [Alkalihalophilus lindianensis]